MAVNESVDLVRNAESYGGVDTMYTGAVTRL